MFAAAAESSTVSVWVPAAAGLAGVLIGALLETLRVWLLDRRNERAQATAAARVLELELVNAGRLLALMARDRKWDYIPAVTPTIDAWSTHQGVLSRSLDDRDWTPVAKSFDIYGDYLRFYSDHRGPMDPGQVQHAIDALGVFEVAWRAIRVASARSPRERRARRRQRPNPPWARTLERESDEQPTAPPTEAPDGD